jgi:protein-tyrosine-phosphatase
MAEALLRHQAEDWVAVFSAGSHPKPVHAHAVAVMAEHGIDISQAYPKHLDEFGSDRLDYVITLCDRVREVCPQFPGHPEPVHWSIPDPASEPEGYPAFARCADELARRIGFLMHRITTASRTEN